MRPLLKQEPDQYRLSAATDTTELCQNMYQPLGHTFRDIARRNRLRRVAAGAIPDHTIVGRRRRSRVDR